MPTAATTAVVDGSLPAPVVHAVPAGWWEELSGALDRCLRDDLWGNEHEQNRQWAMEQLEELVPGYWELGRWEFEPDHDNNVMIASEAEAGIRAVMVEMVRWDLDLVALAKLSGKELVQAVDGAVSDFFCSCVWGDFGVGAYYMDGAGNLYTLEEYAAWLRGGPVPEQAGRVVWGGE